MPRNRSYQSLLRRRGNRDYRPRRGRYTTRRITLRRRGETTRVRTALSKVARSRHPLAAAPALGTEQWPALRELSSMDALPTSSYRYLLDLDDDLPWTSTCACGWWPGRS